MLSYFKAFVWNRINGDATFFNPDVVTKFDVVAIGKYADKVEVHPVWQSLREYSNAL